MNDKHIYQVTLDTMTGRVVVKNGVVIKAESMFFSMLGKHWVDCESFIIQKEGTVIYVLSFE